MEVSCNCRSILRWGAPKGSMRAAVHDEVLTATSVHAAVRDEVLTATLRTVRGNPLLDPGLARPSPPASREILGILHGERAKARMDAGNLTRAADEAAQAVLLHPTSWRCWEHKASVHAARGQTGAAAQCLANAANLTGTGSAAAKRDLAHAEMSHALQAALVKLCSPDGQRTEQALSSCIVRVLDCVSGHAEPGPSLLRSWRAVLHDKNGGMLSASAYVPLRPGEVLSRHKEFQRKSAAIARVVIVCRAWAHWTGIKRIDPRVVLEAAVIGLKAAQRAYKKILRSHLQRLERTYITVEHARLQLELGSALLRRVWGSRDSPQQCREQNVEAALVQLRDALAAFDGLGPKGVDWAEAATRLAHACHHQAGIEAARSVSETPAQAEKRARAMFAELDADGGGTLDEREVAAMAERLGAPLRKKELKEALLSMDEDGSGEVDVEEFLLWFQEIRNKPSKLGLAVQNRWASEALELLRKATLQVFTPNGEHRLQWARCRMKAGEVLASRDGPGDIDEGIAAFRDSQRVFSRSDHPREWAIAERQVGELKQRSSRRDQAIACFQRSLDAIDRSVDPVAWRAAQQRLASASWNEWGRVSGAG